MAERVGLIKLLPVRSRLSDQLGGATRRAARPEKTDGSARAVGVWDRKSGDRIKGCDGTCIHAVGSLARADG